MTSQSHSFLQDEHFPGLLHPQSVSPIASTINHHHLKKSKNPYHQERDLDPEQHPISGVRKKTPIRAVFDDLPTAHSSITSGKIKLRGTDDDSNNNGSNEDEDSIPLQELDVTNRPDDIFSNLPLPPLPVVISEGRYGRDDHQATDKDVSNHRARLSQLLQPVAPGPSRSMFANIKNALASISSPLSRDAVSDRPISSLWPRDSLDLEDNVKRRSLRHVETKPSKEDINTSATQDNASERTRYGVTGSSNMRQTANPNEPSIYLSSLGDSPARSLHSRSCQCTGNLHDAEVNLYNRYQGREHSGPEDGPQFLDFPLSPTTQEPKLARKLSKTTSASNDGSKPEGSTVGNIYKHYVRSDELEYFSDDDDDDNSEPRLPELNSLSPLRFRDRPSAHPYPSSSLLPSDQLRPSALFLRKHLRADKEIVEAYGQPPKFSLPKVPNIASQHLIPCSNQVAGQQSSDGDPRNLLETTKSTNLTDRRPPISRSDGRHDLRSDQAVSEIESSSKLGPPRLNPNNPFQVDQGPQVVASLEDAGFVVYGDDVNFDYPIADRLPLEREVSEALRRVSGFSAYSNGSITSSALEPYGEQSASTSKSIGMLRRQKIKDIPPSDSESVDGEARVIADQANAFYNQGAIASNWVTTRQHNVVRVPINHNGSMPDSPPNSPIRDAETPFVRRQPAPEDDQNDWETVGESAFGFEIKSSKETGLIGGTINRAGSSIANTSDEGTVSSHVPEIEDFSSTERIAQHPGHIRYFGDYRQRDLKETHIPVFLPVFREHKVNGYLADSTRMRPPPPPFNFVPPRLARTHTNPFKSPPPEVMQPLRAVRPSGMQQHQRTRTSNHFQRSLQTLNTEREDTDQILDKKTSSAMKPFNTVESSRQTFKWMDYFGEPGPAISTQGKYLRSSSPDQPAFGQHVMELASQGHLLGDNKDTPNVTEDNLKTSSYSNNLYRVSGLQGTNQVDGLGESKPFAGRNLIKKRREHAPLVKGPPGAFYQGLRSKPGESKRRSWSEQHDRQAKTLGRNSSIKDYPTNTLRPLSLLPRPSTPVTPFERRPSEDVLTNDFVYRSPLAPPKHDSWKKLYSKSQLQGIREAAKADGFVEVQAQPTSGLLRVSLKEGGSRKHLFETPTLKPWKRNDSARTDLSTKRKKFSIIVLCLCGTFPPMLILYALGSLDGIIVWWTSGEFSTFAKQQRRWAYILMYCWGMATFLGLVAFLVYWFSGLRSPG